MRRSWGIGLGLVLLIGLVPTSAAADPVTETTVRTYFVAPEGPPPAAGSRVSFWGVLESAEKPVAGARLTLSARPHGGTEFRVVGQATTGVDGQFSAAIVLRRSSELLWSFAGDSRYAAATSRPFWQGIGPRVAVRVADRTPARRERVLILGATTPARPGQRVSLWHGDRPAFMPGNAARRVAIGRVRADGSFRLTASFGYRGAKQLFVKVNAGAGNAEGYSRYLRIRVR